MKKIRVLFLVGLGALCGCQTSLKKDSQIEYLRWVGDIPYDASIDGDEFKVCRGDDWVLQYFNVGEGPRYHNEKSSVINLFKREFQPLSGKNQNGLIRIRFIVNCEGKSGRFRVLQSDYDYNETEFDDTLVSQLLQIIQTVEQWEILYQNETPIDYYMYLIFRINDGHITEILP